MNNYQLSINFKLSEFTSIPIEQVKKIQLFLMQSIAKNVLEIIRSQLSIKFNKKVPITITSAWRTPEKYNELKQKGFNPSETSDHFYNVPVPVYSNEKKAIWGDFYPYSVGAVDFVPADVDIKQSFDLICQLVKNGVIDVGQIIHEFDPGKNVSWIHISNPPKIIYSIDFVNTYLNRSKYLTSIDGGKTYQSLNI